MRDWLRLVRAPLAPTAACDAVACALLARGPGAGAGPAAGASDLLLLAATSVLVYAAGMAGNDLADRRRDVVLHPERPLPSGRLPVAAAAVLVAALAAGAVALGGGPAGSRVAVVVAVVLAAAYDGGAKRALVPGALAMGGVRAANAATGVLPLVLAGTAPAWTLLAPACVGLYSAGITVLSTAEDRPDRASARRHVASATTALAFAGAAVLALAAGAGPVFGAFFAGAVVLSATFRRVPRAKAPVGAQVLEMLLGFYWLDAVLATGGAEGSAWALAVAAFGGAFALILGSQIAVRALRR
ncbi:MAG: UbiA family prenyltransferase [Planctomycetes bacterium]|nr:UbiA family prenyltransferase [Planctomycetota bacterium]